MASMTRLFTARTYRPLGVGFALLCAALGTRLVGQSDPSLTYRFTMLPSDSNQAFGADDGAALTARFYGPGGVASDGVGNVYVADSYNHTIRRISGDGVVTTFAGTAGVHGSADGGGSVARFYYPKGLAVDGAGNVYVADTFNHAIRVISPAGVVSTLAGTLGQSGNVDGTGAVARFFRPTGLAVDSFGNVIVADTFNGAVRKVTPAGVVTTLIAFGGGTDSRPMGVAIDGTNQIFVSNRYSVLKISAAGAVSPWTGSPRALGNPLVYWQPDSYHDSSPGQNAGFEDIQGLAADGAGNVFVADGSNHAIRKVDPTGVVTTLAGGPPLVYTWTGSFDRAYATYVSQPGNVDGVGPAARFYYPAAVAVDQAGSVYVADTANATVRKITATGVVATIAGVARAPVGATVVASQTHPGLAVDEGGTVFLADRATSTIVQRPPQGVGHILAGATGQVGSADGPGPAARFAFPSGVAVDAAGRVVVADTENQVIRRISPAGDVTTLAGLAGQSGSADGTGPSARFSWPQGVAVDGNNTVYVAELDSVRKVTSAGTVTTLVSPRSSPTSGVVANPGFSQLAGVAISPAGALYLADTNNRVLYTISASGVSSALAGESGLRGTTDGIGSNARFNSLQGVAVDYSSNSYVTDTLRIRRVSPTGVVTTLVNSDGPQPWEVDPLLARQLSFPDGGIALDGYGAIYVANQRGDIIKGELTTPVVAIAQQPRGQRVAVGLPALLSIDVVSADPVSYQWKKDGVAVAGATSSSYLLPRISLDDAGAYTVTVTTTYGRIRSDAAQVTVVPFGPASFGRADFNGDGRPDLLWENSVTRERAIWMMDGTNFLSSSSLGFFEPGWSIAATGDFNGDGKTDIVWSSDITGERALWLMNGPFLLGISTFGIFPLEWTVAATGDFDGDGQPDLVWSNSVTGERALWLMNGTNFKAASTLGFFPLEWTVAATGDFNADGKPDIVWSNSITGERAIWLMNGTNFLAASTLGVFPLEWTVRGTADFNADGKPDIIWSNSITGERALWLMNGTNFLGASTLGTFPLEWTVKN